MSEYERVSHVRLFVTLWTVALQTYLSMGLSRQEYWSGLPCPSSGDLRDSGIKPGSPALQVDSLPSEPLGKPNIIWQLKLNFFKKDRQTRVLGADIWFRATSQPFTCCVILISLASAFLAIKRTKELSGFVCLGCCYKYHRLGSL